MHNIIVIGAVNTTAKIIEKLFEFGFNVSGILGNEPKDTNLVSGFADLKSLANKLLIPYKGFIKINDEENINWAKNKNPDLIFAVGFSQLLHEEWFSVAKYGCIGFHPTVLPIGRGRAPLAWITLEKTHGSATFFLMGKGADDGPIFIQSVFEVEEDDDATSVEKKILQHIDIALNSWLPELKNGVWNPIPQSESLASYYGMRKPEDGLINWNDDAYSINRLIKASTNPHPGAYTYFKDQKIFIWKSELENNLSIKGIVGRILINDSNKLLIQTGRGLLWILDYTFPPNSSEMRMNVGDKLGYNLEDEIFKIKLTLKKMKNE